MRNVFLLLLCALAGVFAQNLTLEATGYGATLNEATVNAKREALAQGIGQSLMSQTEVENFMVKRDYILTQTMGHVKSAQVLSQKQGPDGAWEVKVRAVVAKDGLSKDLAALMVLKESVGNPRIAMLIKETVLGNDDPTANKAEILLIDFFKGKTFEVVDPSAALRYRESSDGIKAMGGDLEAAAKLGAALNAEVIIVGNVVAKESDVSNIPAMAKSGMKSASAVVSLKAVNVSTRQIMAAKSVDAPAAHINAHTAGNMAVEKSVKKLMEGKGGFFDAIVESWRSSANDGAVFQLNISGVASFAEVKAAKAALQSKVAKLDQRGFAKPELQLDATFLGSVEDLCEKLDGLPIESRKLSVESYQGNVIQLKLK
jgi:hypothetical protein